MPTNIDQIRDAERKVTRLRIDGEMFGVDAALVYRIATCIHADTGDSIILDLADLDLLDSEAATILRDLVDREGYTIEGMEIFLQTVVNNAERQDL